MALKFLACTIRSFNPSFANLILDHWYEYEAGESRTSVLVRQMDKLERMDQAVIYEERSGEDLSEFMAVRADIDLPELKPWLEILLQNYENLKSRKNANIVVVFVSGITYYVRNHDEAELSQEGLVSARELSALELRENSVSTTYPSVICCEMKRSLRRPHTETSFQRASKNRCLSRLN